jgi:hypothetical protein
MNLACSLCSTRWRLDDQSDHNVLPLIVLLCVEGSTVLSQLLKPVLTYALIRLPMFGEPCTNLLYHLDFTHTE